jgi:uncharacterized protein (DUF488 family)
MPVSMVLPIALLEDHNLLVSRTQQDDPNGSRTRIFTIGHGRGTFGDVQQRLDRHHVATLIDIRSEPYSRHAPDFEREALREHCRAAGIGYLWMGDRLGGRPRHPALLDEEGAPDWEAVARSPGFQAGIGEVLTLAADGRVALLCAEADPAHCHRSFLVAPALEERGAEVYHILPDGSLARHQPTLGI